jgi:hypothetical protein
LVSINQQILYHGHFNGQQQEPDPKFNMKFSTSLAIVAAASSASAHTIMVSVNGGAVGDGVRVPSYDGVCLILNFSALCPSPIRRLTLFNLFP